MARSISDLRADGAALVIVEIHGGFQFSDVASDFAVRAAHAAIDAGVDLVVGHHPHVLQGFEWYNGHLIAYSLGNFVFDQDFLSTFPSVILRTIFEGDRLIDARVIPLSIDRYQPAPVTGAAAARVIRLMDARSALTAYSDRIEPRVTASIIDPHRAANAAVSDTGMTGLITKQRDGETVSYRLGTAGQAALPPCALVRAGSFAGDSVARTGVEVGVDLMQWGDIDDVTADDQSVGGSQWVLSGNVTVGVDGENQYLHLQASPVRGATARQIARSATPLHRWYDANLKPVDGEPSYTVQMRTRGKGVTGARLRVAVYDVNDTDPTTEPVSTLLREDTVAMPVPDIDDVRLMEWRDLRDVPDGVWVPADAVRGAAGAELTVEQSGCVARGG